MSFVGAPIGEGDPLKFNYKPGITGLIQINTKNLNKENAYDNYEMYYLKSQSLFLDLEILLTSLFKK